MVELEAHLQAMTTPLCIFSSRYVLWEILRKYDVFCLENMLPFLENPKHLWGIQSRIQQTSQGKYTMRALINTYPNSGRSNYFQPWVSGRRIEAVAQEGVAE